MYGHQRKSRNKKYLDIIDNLNNRFEENIDFLQHQINIISKSYNDIYTNLHITNENQRNIIQKINTICNKNIESGNNFSKSDYTVDSASKNIIFTEPSSQHFQVPPNVNIIFITMIGGGGAGGIGYIDGHYYYGGGGGGAGACIIKKPVQVNPNTDIHLTIGRGGHQNPFFHGEPSILEIINGCNITKIVASGGQNGFPQKDNDTMISNTDGGTGGKSDLACFLNGCDGHRGSVSIPSQKCATGGNGGSSAVCLGGNGGGNYFSTGATGGTINNIIGCNGSYGSGGGGSCPRHNICQEQPSGNGGDGMILIEW